MFIVLALFSSGCGGGSQPAKADKGDRVETPGAGDKADRVERPRTADKGEGPTKGQPGKASFALTPEEFTREFLKDQKAADAKYRGKVVELTGEVVAVRTSDLGKSAFLRMEGVKEQEKDIAGLPVQIRLRPEFTRTGLRLSPKQKIKVIADYEGYFANSGIEMTNGALEELSKSEVVCLSASELAQEFDKDAKAAAKKYAKKDLVVTGEVEKVGEEPVGYPYTRLKGNGKTRVFARTPAHQFMLKGKTVGLRGQLDDNPLEKNEVRIVADIVEVK